MVLLLDKEGNIFVADSENYRIQKFTSGGEFLTVVNTLASAGNLVLPRGIAVNPANGKVYVTFSHGIQVFNSDLKYSGASQFGKQGHADGELFHPIGISCDNAGNVYVADSGNHRIQVFTSDGQFLRVIGRKDELSEPSSVVVDADNLVYVSDCGNCRVCVFTQQGRFVTSFGKKGVGVGEFSSPQGLAVDSSGVVYVCDAKNNTIQLF